MKIVKYKPPEWFVNHILAKPIIQNNDIPSYRFKFLDQQNCPTRIEKLNLKQLKNTKYELYIKRDDLTHSSLHLQGNKIRKLEFLFADAIMNHNSKHILTAGGLQSNHCRAVAGLSQMLNLKAHLFLRSHTANIKEINENSNGNLLIDRLLDANIYLIEKKAQYSNQIVYKMNILKEKLERKLNENCYIIPIGGSNKIGFFGYMEQFNEMLEQNIDKYIDDIIVTTGSGGTMSSLAIGNYLTGSKFKIHAFCVCDNREYFSNHLIEEFTGLFSSTKINSTNIDKICNIIECSKGFGYGQSTKEELIFLIDVFKQTGILLDPVYTNKTLYALVNLLTNKQPTLAYQNDKAARDFLSNLKGNKLLFIHTGGQMGLFENFKFNSIFQDETRNIFNCFGKNIEDLNI